MFDIRLPIALAPSDGSAGPKPAGEQFYLITSVTIHDGLVRLIPHTKITPLTTDLANNRCTYKIEVRGCTAEQFVRVVKAFAAGTIAFGLELIDDIKQS